MMVLIDRKFNEEQLLLKTFFPKMHIEQDIRFKTPLKKAPDAESRCFTMLFRTSFLEHFPHFAGSFCNFFPHLPRA